MAKIHELWPSAARLSPARDRLRQAIAALNEATCASEAATKPLRRLDRVIAEKDTRKRVGTGPFYSLWGGGDCVMIRR